MVACSENSSVFAWTPESWLIAILLSLIVGNELPGGSRGAFLTPPALSSTDCLTEVTACNLFTGLEVPLVISHKEAFDGYLDTVIGEVFFWCVHSSTIVIWLLSSSKYLMNKKWPL